MTWILGWGVYSNLRAIKKIKENLRILEGQNVLQEFKICLLAKYLNVTHPMINRHENMLYEIDSRMYIFERTLQDIMNSISAMQHEIDLLDHIQIRLNRIHSSLFALTSNTDTIYEYLGILASHILNLMVIPPEVMCSLLQEVQIQMAHNPRLKLFDDVDNNIWEFYENLKVTPIVMGDFLMVILTIPLVDESLQMNLFKIHNLPLLHPKLQIKVTHDLEGEYFATLMQGMYMALPDANNIKLCMVSQGHLCMFDQAMYPVDTTPWCIYTLFINYLTKIRKLCCMKLKPQMLT